MENKRTIFFSVADISADVHTARLIGRLKKEADDLRFVGLGGAALAPTLSLLFVAQLFIGLSQGIGYPVLMGMSIQHVVDANRTTAMGLHQAVYAIGMFSGPWLSGILADAVGIRPMFGITACAVLLSSLVATRQLVEKTAAKERGCGIECA